MQKITITKYLGMLVLVFRDKEITDGFVEVYYDMLKDLPEQVLKTAIQECMVSCKFFPTIADIRGRATDCEVRIENIPSPEMAWAEIQDNLRTVGNYGKPEFSHEIINQAMYAIGGWHHVCVEANIEIVRAQYMRIYQSMVSKYKTDLLILPQTKEYIGLEKSKRKRLEAENPASGLINTLTSKFSDVGTT